MSNQWLRLWHDMPNDPKWRTIARISGQRIGDVIATYNHLLVSASTNPMKRGETTCNAEDVSTALDIEIAQVEAILSAMQGRVLDGNWLSGWEIRQPKKEDNSTDRVKAHRERNAVKQNETPCNARIEEIREDKKEVSKLLVATSAPTSELPLKEIKAKRKTRLPDDWELPQEWGDWAESEGLSGDEIIKEADKFKDRQKSIGAAYSDWQATWRNWIRNYIAWRAKDGLQAKR